MLRCSLGRNKIENRKINAERGANLIDFEPIAGHEFVFVAMP